MSLIIEFTLSFFEFFDIKRKNILLEISSAIVFILVFIIFGFNRMNNDYEAYLSMYNGVHRSPELGFEILMKSLKYLGISYNVFLIILAFLLIKQLYTIVQKKYFILSTFIYSIYNLIFDINQIRNLIMMLIVNLIIIDQKIKYKKSMILIILSSFIHRFSYIYIFFLPLQKLSFKKYLKIMILGAIMVPFFYQMMKYFFIKFFPDKAFSYLLHGETQTLGFLLYYVYFIMELIIIIIYSLHKEIEKENIMLKFSLFPIFFLGTGLISRIIPQRMLRNATFAKLGYLTSNLKKLKFHWRIVVCLIIFMQYAMFVFYASLSSKIYFNDVWGDFNFIKFSF